MLVAAVVMLISSCALIMKVNNVVPDEYMDEIYHADQMQRYCAGNYSSWNPLITTPPGLYLASLAIILPASLLASDQLVV
uniref:Dol-P-Glc:Glc(2)Man(9)GlcNAc(2)-PP-Dol alpha-1,2-glucosyltransferase n=1 Tax=Plectus sambesii TaxID=2011161 RepID=A0A914VQ64_9BILA